ncbi:hypothetical protein M885DRAFT_549075 [Pelagophyceae sp. CCMP2097]|nr:hypothetical protein M885DRAFT_549075 [Pelagophyceae sp. CCMP2097]
MEESKSTNPLLGAHQDARNGEIEIENRALIVGLQQADAYYQEQQRLAKTIRKGFLDLAKARQSSASPISALNCREELCAQYLVENDEDYESLGIEAAGAADAWRAFNPRGISLAQQSLRRRGGADDAVEELHESGMRADSDGPDEVVDPVLLFAGFPSPALRKAKKEFVHALTHMIKLANAIQRMRAAQHALEKVDTPASSASSDSS